MPERVRFESLYPDLQVVCVWVGVMMLSTLMVPWARWDAGSKFQSEGTMVSPEQRTPKKRKQEAAQAGRPRVPCPHAATDGGVPPPVRGVAVDVLWSPCQRGR